MEAFEEMKRKSADRQNSAVYKKPVSEQVLEFVRSRLVMQRDLDFYSWAVQRFHRQIKLLGSRCDKYIKWNVPKPRNGWKVSRFKDTWSVQRRGFGTGFGISIEHADLREHRLLLLKLDKPILCTIYWPFLAVNEAWDLKGGVAVHMTLGSCPAVCLVLTIDVCVHRDLAMAEDK